MKPFQIPEDGYHASTIYSQSGMNVAETSTTKRSKITRESPTPSTQASQQVDQDFTEYQQQAEQEMEFQDESYPLVFAEAEHLMHPSFYIPYPQTGDWDNLIDASAINFQTEKENQVINKVR